MLEKVSKIGRTDVSAIVRDLNSLDLPTPLYEKHKRTTSEIDAEISDWYKVDNGFFKISSIDWINRSCHIIPVFTATTTWADQVREVANYIFNTYNLTKIGLEVFYDRHDILKQLQSLGFCIDVRKRQHFFSSGKFTHVLELSLFKEEMK